MTTQNLRDYYKRYREIAAEYRISLADESKPEKAFAPTGGDFWNLDDRRWSVLKLSPFQLIYAGGRDSIHLWTTTRKPQTQEKP